MASISAANSVVMLAITGLYTVPQQLQGFSADDVFDAEAVSDVEVLMGVDGTLSAGYVPQPVKQSITFQADSASILMFEAWSAAQKAAGDVYFAQGLVTLPGVGRIYTCSRGVLSSYSPLPTAKKLLQPRKFGITWESVIGASL
ncbi:hypothetical protein GALL_207700 [mine drainage metagenome]|uniref:Uncharacterized protein n=1 Tax=mine drainage metagenome TaxID=410659 RepID=A0A1J5RLY0_9ZZZZ